MYSNNHTLGWQLALVAEAELILATLAEQQAITSLPGALPQAR